MSKHAFCEACRAFLARNSDVPVGGEGDLHAGIKSRRLLPGVDRQLSFIE
jgi:hypothetical protein